ncbi:DUF6576 domain-containing protein [Chryseolinea lacunae]|uniref:DUF6576 domain-containing protein n=1 Tax=Chryseolinea lacunae TaxID=2801331 RepID=A0ABS1KPR6_9BACT|nr:DUF6576 domain-containing protein [Chryseolinea lacunae]MBL0741416.1 hypothetical protein [Chryseolinea lacunae]
MNLLFMLALAGIGVYVYRTYFSSGSYETKDERYNAERVKKQKELDGLLDKIAANGMDSLSEQERRRLDELSGGH